MREFMRDGDLIPDTSGMAHVDRTMCCGSCGQRMNSVVLADNGRTEMCCRARHGAPVCPSGGCDLTLLSISQFYYAQRRVQCDASFA
jgi:hypothetical protein